MNRKNLDETIRRVVRKTINEVRYFDITDNKTYKKYYKRIKDVMDYISTIEYKNKFYDEFSEGLDDVYNRILSIDGIQECYIDELESLHYEVRIQVENGEEMSFNFVIIDASDDMYHPYKKYIIKFIEEDDNF